MKLLLRRNQKQGGLLGNKITFTLSVRADLSPEEKADIKKYQLGHELLYARKTLDDPGEGWTGVGRMILHGMTNLTVSVNDLDAGKQVDCKDIIEMLGVEEQIKEAAKTFKAVLHAASTFGGEEAIEL